MKPSEMKVEKLEVSKTKYFEVTRCRLLWKDDYLITYHVRFLGWPDRGSH